MVERWVADFETTTDASDCRVWAVGMCPIAEPFIPETFNTIDDMFEWLAGKDIVLYFHNLKFDGEFILVWLFNHGLTHTRDRKLHNGEFSTLISDTGQFYSIEIRSEQLHVTIYDSLKIIPLPVDCIPKAYGLQEHKLEIDYMSKRPVGHKLTQEEIDYVSGDVIIVAKALSIVFDQGLKRMTCGSNALADYKSTLTKQQFKRQFPAPTDECEKFVRKSYHGGWTYVNPKYQNKTVRNGIVLDVNSLYPSVMYYELMPFGNGVYYTGRYSDDPEFPLYIQRLRCTFVIKKNHLPTIQLKHTMGYMPTEYATTSSDKTVELTMTSVDLALFMEQYDVFDIEYVCGYKYMAKRNMFKAYIDKWMDVKMAASKDDNQGMRSIAKLMLNNLYGKFALNPAVQSKYPILENGAIRYHLGPVESREALYIPVGSFVTAYARTKTIMSAQRVYSRFIYADTDSLHLLGNSIPDGIDVDPVRLGAWKHESTFETGKFLHAKCYVEVMDGNLNVTCAGLPAKCRSQVTFENFRQGAVYHGKLTPKHVPGGIVLFPVDFSIK